MLVTTLAVLAALLLPGTGFPADNTRPLLGTWVGKATGPEGGPPTGDITVVFERDDAAGIKGTITVKGSGGLQYAGQISNISLKKRVFSGTAVFKLGENPLQAEVSGPLKGKTIAGTFSVVVQGQKIGEGTFSITRK